MSMPIDAQTLSGDVLSKENSSIMSNGKEIHRYNGTNTVVIVPDSINKILTWAFKNNAQLTHVYIQGAVEIESGAFTGCISLESVVSSEAITKIGYNAFKGCTSLKNFDFNEGITEISSSVFEGCTALERVQLPADVKVIKDSAFSGCSSLLSVDLPKGLAEIGDGAFYQCVNLADITIPDSVKKIGLFAFANCNALKSLHIPNSVEKLGKFADNMDSLEVLSLPGCIKKLSSGFMPTSKALKLINLGSGIESIDKNVFWGNKNLCAVIIPPSVTKIAPEAFATLQGIKNFKPTLSARIFASKKVGEVKTQLQDVIAMLSDENADDIKEYMETYGCSSPAELLKNQDFIREFNSQIFEGLTIFGAPGSAAEKYAAENGLSFEDMNTLGNRLNS